jgi:Ca2+-binding EF-hand superfamily protein
VAIVCKAPDKLAWCAWPEVKLEISTKAGERLGLDLAATTTGGVEVRANTIGVNAGSRLLSINGQDMRRSAPQEVAAMLLEADGLVELHFAIATPSKWSTFISSSKGSILTWLSSSGSPSPVLPAASSRPSGEAGGRSKWAGGLGSLTNKARRPVNVTELAWDDRSVREIVLGWLREHTLYGAVASFLFGDGPKLPTGAQACQLLWTTVLGLLYIVCMQIRFSWLAGDRVHALTTNGASTSERAPFVTAVAFVSTIILYPCLLAGRGLFMMVNRQKLVYNQAHGLTRIATDTKAALTTAMAGAIALHKSLDLDGDGKVTAAELYMAAKAKARERTARLKKMRDDLRASLDTDGDGKVSWSEMRAGMRRLRREMAAQTKSAFQERRERLRKMRAELRASLDTDGDGKVSAAEFAAGMRRLRKEAAARARERAKQMGANPLFSTTLAFASVWGITFFLMLALAVGSVSAAASMDERVVREDVISAWWLAMALQWLLIEPIIVAVTIGFNLLSKRMSTFEGGFPDIAALNLKITKQMTNPTK